MAISYEKKIYETLKGHLTSFLSQKRALGYKYTSEENDLNAFIKFVAVKEPTNNYLTKILVETYCERHVNETDKSVYNRVCDVRQFTKYLNQNGFEAYIPRLPKLKRSSFTPYIFTHEEMGRIFIAVDSIKPDKRYNCSEVYPVLFRMLYSCGLRVSEALNLLVSDVDLSSGALLIRAGKFKKTRLVPMPDSLIAICADLVKMIHTDSNGDDFFFKNRDGTQRSKKTVAERFRMLLWESGIPYKGKGYGPRLHDVRHTYCCHAMKQMADAGLDLYYALPILSTFVGHASIDATEKYIRLTKEFYLDILSQMHNSGTRVYPEVYYDETN